MREEELGRGRCGYPDLESEDLRKKQTISKMPWHIISFETNNEKCAFSSIPFTISLCGSM